MGLTGYTDTTPENCVAREILDRVASKWSLYVIYTLGDGTKRFTELKREVDGISQRMLTVTLRGLERDGLITRTMHPVMPPHVDYQLTELGCTLLTTVSTLMNWAHTHLPDINAARAAYDERETLAVQA